MGVIDRLLFNLTQDLPVRLIPTEAGPLQTLRPIRNARIQAIIKTKSR